MSIKTERPKRLSVNQKLEIVNYALSNPKMSQIQIAAKFAKEYGLSHTSKQTMSRVLDKEMVKKLQKIQISDESSLKILEKSNTLNWNVVYF